MKRYGSGMWTTIYPDMTEICSALANEHRITMNHPKRRAQLDALISVYQAGADERAEAVFRRHDHKGWNEI